ncbi:MAG: hypothetical protein MUE98_00575 [Rhodobacteraceae bacterium]|jgi:hypothetical protein|nr:hypothetical protein [Paracoccaceae bacterium]
MNGIPHIEVSDVRRPEAPYKTPSGQHVEWVFTVKVAGLIVQGCMLLHRPDKGWTIWGPTPRVLFTRRVRRELKAAVLAAAGAEVPRQMLAAE